MTFSFDGTSPNLYSVHPIRHDPTHSAARLSGCPRDICPSYFFSDHWHRHYLSD